MFFPSGITEEVREVPPRLLIDVDPILSTLSGSEPVVIPAVIANETVIAVPASVALNITSSPELSEATKVDPAWTSTLISAVNSTVEPRPLKPDAPVIEIEVIVGAVSLEYPTVAVTPSPTAALRLASRMNPLLISTLSAAPWAAKSEVPLRSVILSDSRVIVMVVALVMIAEEISSFVNASEVLPEVPVTFQTKLSQFK